MDYDEIVKGVKLKLRFSPIQLRHSLKLRCCRSLALPPPSCCKLKFRAATITVKVGTSVAYAADMKNAKQCAVSSQKVLLLWHVVTSRL